MNEVQETIKILKGYEKQLEELKAFHIEAQKLPTVPMGFDRSPLGQLKWTVTWIKDNFHVKKEAMEWKKKYEEEKRLKAMVIINGEEGWLDNKNRFWPKEEVMKIPKEHRQKKFTLSSLYIRFRFQK